jgi:D-serine/D-alanine/glycine transporter
MKYRKVRPDLHEKSIYKMPLGVPMCWVIMGFFAFVIYLCALEPDTLTGLKATPLWFAALAVCYVFYQKNLPASVDYAQRGDHHKQ